MSKSTVFQNHAPVNLAGADLVASYESDGGVYNGIGSTDYSVYKGKRYHVPHYYTSGCDYGDGGSHTSTYLFGAATKEEIVAWLLAQMDKSAEDAIPSEIVSILLRDLGYAEEA